MFQTYVVVVVVTFQHFSLLIYEQKTPDIVPFNDHNVCLM